MVSYLEHSSDGIFDPPFLQPADFPPHHILELGSGTGIVSSRLAQHIKKAQGTLIVTDLPEVCPLLEQNLASFTQHKSTRIDVIVRSLSWGNKQHALDIYRELRSRYAESFGTVPVLTHIICSDLVGDFYLSLWFIMHFGEAITRPYGCMPHFRSADRYLTSCHLYTP